MKRGLIAALALTGLFALGCDDASKDAADTKASEAKDAAKDATSTVKSGAEAAKDAPSGMTDAAADAIKKQADALLSDIKTAVDKRDWSKAEDLIKKYDDLKDKIPEGYRKTVDGQIATFKTAIENGKKLTAPAP